jgi:tetratricopeptide (TPR) repeat protein
MHTFCYWINAIWHKCNSKECQVAHWKQHKSACTTIKKQYDVWKEAMNNVLPDATVNDAKEGPCAICLEETITNPVVLPCGHAFCFECVGSYQFSSNSKECPYCRGEIPDVVEKASERTVLYVDRARASPKGSDERIKFAKLALAEHDALSGIIMEMEKDDEGDAYLGMLCMGAELMSMTGQPEETIKITGRVLSLNEKYSGILSFTEVVQTKCYQARAYSDCGKWKDAIKSYKLLIREHRQHGLNPSSLTLIDYSQALYELRKYDEAIEMGNTAIEKNRSCPGVHKYVALSRKANGDIDEAKKTMARAILYEEHWDKDNLQKNKQLLRELNNI